MQKTLTIYAFIITSIVFAQEPANLYDALNIATKQRVLAQKMAKDKLFLEVNKKTNIAQKELEKSTTEFEKNLHLLKNFALTKQMLHEIEEQEFAYRLYKDLILETTKKSMSEIVKHNSLFLSICDDVVKNIITYSKANTTQNKNKKYITENIALATSAASRVKLLSQRLVLYYGLNIYKIENIKPNQIKDISKKIENNLNYLTLLEFNTLEIDDSLGEVVFLWNQIKSEINNSDKISPLELFDLCNEILIKADNTTQLYVDLNKS